MTVERDWFWFWFWFYYALWLASVFTLVLVLRQSSENRSITLFSYSTWSQFIDEMKTLEYKNLVVIGNPLADTPTNDVSQGETINIKPSI